MTDIRDRLVKVILNAHDGDPQGIALDVLADAILAAFPVLKEGLNVPRMRGDDPYECGWNGAIEQAEASLRRKPNAT